MDQYGTYEVDVAGKKEDDPIAALSHMPRFPVFSCAALADRSDTVRREASKHAETAAKFSGLDAALSSVRDEPELRKQ